MQVGGFPTKQAPLALLPHYPCRKWNAKFITVMSKVKSIFPVLQMGCAACAARVESVVSRMPGVAAAAVNFASSELSVEYDPALTSPEKIRDAVRQAGYDLLVEESSDSDRLEDIQKKK